VQGQQTVLEVIHLQSKPTLCTVLTIPHDKLLNNAIFSNIFPFNRNKDEDGSFQHLNFKSQRAPDIFQFFCRYIE
jgi:hypothetical protein